MRRTVLYVLEGAWNTGSIDGCQVLGISEDREVLQDKLELVAGSRAEEYVMGHVWNGINEERGERHYEIIDDTGSWAKFYITEHYVDISEALMGAISHEVEKINCIKNIWVYLRSLYECGDTAPWKYEYMEGNDKAAEEILMLFGKMESCSISYNVTMDAAVVESVKARRLGSVFSEDAITGANKHCTREAQGMTGNEGRKQNTTFNIVPGIPEADEPPAGKAVPDNAVKRAAYRIHKTGGCDAADGYSKGYDDAITLALDIIMEETGFGICEILGYGEEA